jgi:hypothetical protein
MLIGDEEPELDGHWFRYSLRVEIASGVDARIAGIPASVDLQAMTFGLGLIEPEAHAHVGEHRRRRVQMLTPRPALSDLAIQLAEHEVAASDQRSPAELAPGFQRPLKVLLGLGQFGRIGARTGQSKKMVDDRLPAPIASLARPGQRSDCQISGLDQTTGVDADLGLGRPDVLAKGFRWP